MNQKRPNILWGITASVAAIRAPLLAAGLAKIGMVRAAVTERAKHFLDELPDEIEIFDDAAEWDQWQQLGDPIIHIELRKWADVLVIAPLTADCLAKMAGGICDNLLLSVARAWDFDKPVIVAPAMNTKMWEHPVTAGQISLIQSWGISVVDPVVKELACADVGIGALAAPNTIVEAVQRSMATD